MMNRTSPAAAIRPRSRLLQLVDRVIAGREEFFAIACAGWPAIYLTTCPQTNRAADLIAWHSKAAKQLADDMAMLARLHASPPQAPNSAQTAYVDWTGVENFRDQLAGTANFGTAGAR